VRFEDFIIRSPTWVLMVAVIFAAWSIGVGVSWVTGVGTDVNGRPCTTHWSEAEGCRD
jgi:hypothetical protein